MPTDLQWFSENDFSQLFRLQQLTCEYLLYVQETLHNRNINLEAALGATHSQLRDQAEYIGVLESQLAQARQGSSAMIGSSHARCHVCQKVFASDAFLQAHLKRRHPGYSQTFWSEAQLSKPQGGIEHCVSTEIPLPKSPADSQDSARHKAVPAAEAASHGREQGVQSVEELRLLVQQEMSATMKELQHRDAPKVTTPAFSVAQMEAAVLPSVAEIQQE